jgi:hypothetical protein
MFLVSPLKPEDYGLQVYGYPEDMPINRRLLWSPKIITVSRFMDVQRTCLLIAVSYEAQRS